MSDTKLTTLEAITGKIIEQLELRSVRHHEFAVQNQGTEVWLACATRREECLEICELLRESTRRFKERNVKKSPEPRGAEPAPLPGDWRWEWSDEHGWTAVKDRKHVVWVQSGSVMSVIGEFRPPYASAETSEVGQAVRAAAQEKP